MLVWKHTKFWWAVHKIYIFLHFVLFFFFWKWQSEWGRDLGKEEGRKEEKRKERRKKLFTPLFKESARAFHILWIIEKADEELWTMLNSLSHVLLTLYNNPSEYLLQNTAKHCNFLFCVYIISVPYDMATHEFSKINIY